MQLRASPRRKECAKQICKAQLGASGDERNAVKKRENSELLVGSRAENLKLRILLLRTRASLENGFAKQPIGE